MLVRYTSGPDGSQLFDEQGSFIQWQCEGKFMDGAYKHFAELRPGEYWVVESDVIELLVTRLTVTTSRTRYKTWVRPMMPFRDLQPPEDFPEWLRKKVYRPSLIGRMVDRLKGQRLTWKELSGYTEPA